MSNVIHVNEFYSFDVEEVLKSYGIKPNEELYSLLKEYMQRFKVQWPAYGPRTVELVKHCLDLNTKLSDLPDDKIYRKYFPVGAKY